MKRERIHRNTSDLKKGDVFSVVNTVSLAKAGDLTDVCLIHGVHKNGQEFVDSETTWYGLSDIGVTAIKDSLVKAGVTEAVETIHGWKALVKHWRKLTKALGHLNDAGDALDLD